MESKTSMKEIKLISSPNKQLLKLENCDSIATKSTWGSEYSNKSLSKISLEPKEETKEINQKGKQKIMLNQFKKHSSMVNELNISPMKSIGEAPDDLEESPVPQALVQMKSTNARCSAYDKIHKNYMFPK